MGIVESKDSQLIESKSENNLREKVVHRKTFFLNLNELTNKNIVERGIATGLIQNWESAKDVAKKLWKYDSTLWEFMSNIVEQNTKLKRWNRNNEYMTWKDPYNKEKKNPKYYLQMMSDYIIRKINSQEGKEWNQEWTETIKTLFWITQDTKEALLNVFRE